MWDTRKSITNGSFCREHDDQPRGFWGTLFSIRKLVGTPSWHRIINGCFRRQINILKAGIKFLCKCSCKTCQSCIKRMCNCKCKLLYHKYL